MPEKTKKKIKQTDKKDNMWNLFDEEIKNEKNIECIYSKNNTDNDNPDICDSCKSALYLSDDGFKTCSNVKCASNAKA